MHYRNASDRLPLRISERHIQKVSCRDCKFFLPDTVGSGGGVGECAEYNAYKAKKPGLGALRKALIALGQEQRSDMTVPEVFWGGSKGNYTRECSKFKKIVAID